MKLLNSKELSKLLGVSEGTIRNWRVQGKGPEYTQVNGDKRSPIRYLMDDVKEWMGHKPKYILRKNRNNI